VKMSSDEKIVAASWLITISLILALVVVGVTYPKTPEEGTITYRGWTIYQPDVNSTRSSYVATHAGYSPITDSDLQRVIAGIDEVTK